MNIPKIAQRVDGYYIDSSANTALALAEIFCEMLNDDQAAFFNHVKRLSDQWGGPANMQWRMMQDHINSGARDMLKGMYEHTEKSAA